MGYVLKYRAARPYQNYLRVTPPPPPPPRVTNFHKIAEKVKLCKSWKIMQKFGRLVSIFLNAYLKLGFSILKITL